MGGITIMENENDPIKQFNKDFDRKVGFVARMGCSVFILIISVIMVLLAILIGWAMLKS